MAEVNYYKALGVDEKASEQDIKKAFRKLAKEYHPDRNPGDAAKEKRFKEISEAYETLSDKKKRSEYDNLRRFGAFNGGQPGGNPFGSGGGFTSQTVDFGDLGDIFGSMFGGGMGSGGSGGSSGSGFRRTRRGGANPFTEGFGGFNAGPQKGASVSATLSIDFDEAIHGATKQVIISDSAGGRKTIKVKIPKGIDDGEKIRLRGLGAPGSGGGPAGDLIVTVHVKPDRKFAREGNNIISKVTIPFKLAALGGKATVDTLTKKVRVTIPSGTQPGARLRLKGQGLAVGGKKGDLIVEVQVEVPTSLTAEQKAALEKL